VSLLSRSLGLAKGLHQAIIRQGCSILDKNSLKTLRAFRFVTIREGPDLRLFSHASTLTRLALWLVDATRDKATRMAELKKREAAHPIVVACLDEERDTFLVIGISGAPEFGDVKKK
jgi:cell division control protein 45